MKLLRYSCSSLRFFLVLWISLTPIIANGGIINDLYDAKIEVQGQNSRIQKLAARSALERVLVKVTGSYAILQSDYVKGRLAKAEDYIRLFSFNNENDKSFYQASFDAQKIDQLIRTAGYPIWGRRRPSTLVWLAYENSEQEDKLVVSEFVDSPIKLQVSKLATDRGLDLTFPLMDLDDLMNLSVYDIWGRFTDTILTASQRYQPESVISARLLHRDPNAIIAPQVDEYGQPIEQGDPELGSQDNSMVSETKKNLVWQLDWMLNFGEQTTSGTFTDIEKNNVISQLVDMVATNFSGQFAIISGDAISQNEPVKITLLNVDSVESYVHITRFLSSLRVVSKVSMDQLSGSRGTFVLHLIGNEMDLNNALLLDNRIQRQLDEFGQPVSQLEFVWTP